MDVFYSTLFGGLVLLACLLELHQSSIWSNAPEERASKMSTVFRAFRNNYLLVYSLMMGGDWLQGPYIYALYEHYGYGVGEIGQLFIAGFASSMVFGTIVGALADSYGRKAASLLYVAVYSASCLTKHSGAFWVLMGGRLLGGIATSLLFSAFEAWLVAEHNRQGFSEGLLGDTFSKAVFYGGGMMAIISGLMGNLLVEEFRLGPVAPFDAAIFVMLLGAVLISTTWQENYGDASHHGVVHGFDAAFKAILADRRIAALGAIQALFEASMYTWIFLWTPALSPRGEKIPHGMVFACFMTACMAGSALTGQLMRRHKPQRYMPATFAIASATMAVPFLFHLEHRDSAAGSSLSNNGMGGISTEGKLQLLAFCVFEGCVGVFWPSMMALRAHYVPEHMRSTIMNIFRVPLNAFVCLVLCQVHRFPLGVMFGLCVVFLALSGVLQIYLNHLIAVDESADAADDSKHRKLAAELHGTSHTYSHVPGHAHGANSLVLSIGPDASGYVNKERVGSGLAGRDALVKGASSSSSGSGGGGLGIGSCAELRAGSGGASLALTQGLSQGRPRRSSKDGAQTHGRAGS